MIEQYLPLFIHEKLDQLPPISGPANRGRLRNGLSLMVAIVGIAAEVCQPQPRAPSVPAPSPTQPPDCRSTPAPPPAVLKSAVTLVAWRASQLTIFMSLYVYNGSVHRVRASYNDLGIRRDYAAVSPMGLQRTVGLCATVACAPSLPPDRLQA